MSQITVSLYGFANAILHLWLIEDCDYAVGGAIAAARPVIGNTLRTSGSKGEAIEGVTLSNTVSRA